MAKGIKASDSNMFNEDVVWSQNSSDKTDISKELMQVIRQITKSLPINKKLTALSIGSGFEPQFKILVAAFQNSITLLDIDEVPLNAVKIYAKQRGITNVKTVKADYTNEFLTSTKTAEFFKVNLNENKQDLITLHHSLYYSEEETWFQLFENIYKLLLDRKGAIHAVMMASKSDNLFSTTWLYNHFAGKFFNCNNNQNLKKFGKELQNNKTFSNSSIKTKTNKINFWIDDFEKFMAVIWMILLYPNVHNYTDQQKEEITEYIYNNFWIPKQPLVQMQDYLTIIKN